MVLDFSRLSPFSPQRGVLLWCKKGTGENAAKLRLFLIKGGVSVRVGACRCPLEPHVEPNLDKEDSQKSTLFAGKVAIDGLFFLSIAQKNLIVVMGDTKF